MMRCIRCHSFGSIDVLKVENVAKPTISSANQVLVRVYAAGVNPVDTYIREGAYSALPALPYIPGKDGAGVVEECGKDVTHVKAGSRVYTSCQSMLGAYAEYTVCLAHEVYPLQPTLSYSQGAAIGIPYFTAYRALIDKAQAKKGQTVLVHGASGAVGSAAVQIAAARGMIVLGTAGSKEGLELVKQCGAKHAFNHYSPSYVDEIRSCTVDNGGVDVIIEMLANKNLNTDLTLLAYNGTVVVVGCRGDVTIQPRLTMIKDSKILGTILHNAAPADMQTMGEALDAGQKEGWLKPVVGKTFPLEQSGQAQHYVMNNKGSQGKVVIQVHQEDG